MLRLTMLAMAFAVALPGCGDKKEPEIPGATKAPGSKTPGSKAGAGKKTDTAKKAAGDASKVRKEKDARVFHRSLGEPEYLDPGLISESEGGIVTHDTFEGLYQYGRTHKEWPPGVAEKHTISADGRTYTFNLRKNAKWSDGKPVTAKDFEYAWKRVLNPKTGSRYAAIMWLIEGAKAYNQGKGKAEDVKLKAVDDYTFEVTLIAPTPYFIQLTAFYTYQPVPQHVIEKHGDKWARPENIVSNGPFKMTEWRSRQRIVAEGNPHYWDKKAIPFDKVVYHIVQTNEPAWRLYESHDLDFLESRVPETELPKLIKTSNPEHQMKPYMGVYFYMFNVKEKPFDDVRVRHALNMAVDKSKIGKFVIKGGQEAAWDIVHPGLAAMGYKPPAGQDKYDPDKARKLLGAAGFPGGKGFPNFKISYNTLEGHKAIAEFIQQEWKKNLGINCDLDNMEWKVLLKKQHAREFQVSRSSWIGDFLDPMTFLDLWEGENPNNRTNWDNDEFDKLMADALSATDAKARMGMLNKAAEIYARDLPAMPVYFYVKHDMVKPWLKGYKWHLQGVHPVRWFRVEL